MAAVAFPEPKLARHVFISVFEHQNGGLVDFDCKVAAVIIGCVVNVGFFPGRDAAVYGGDEMLV